MTDTKPDSNLLVANYAKDTAVWEARRRSYDRAGGEALLAMVLTFSMNLEYKALSKDFLESCPTIDFVAADGESVLGRYNQEDTSHVPLLTRIKLKAAYRDYFNNHYGSDRLRYDEHYKAPDIDRSSSLRAQRALRNR
ncbi:MAG: hypothetical protein KJ601_07975 [Nanoarchaeota archaeon]|nr:hypothetical protein [Nanoarchaeota archaeon]MBU1703967.1 hypothetical protein [Nanoarchaeota archaeon]